MGKSASPAKTKMPPSSDTTVKTPLTHFDYVKVKKKQDVGDAMHYVNLKSRQETSVGFVAKIFANRIVFSGEKNGKKPPIKKVKFTNVERFAPDKDELAISIAVRQGKAAAVVSFAMQDEEAFTVLVNNLSKTRDSAVEAKSKKAQPKEQPQSKPKVESTSSEFDVGTSEQSATIVQPHSSPTFGRHPARITTTYILWEEEEEEGGKEKGAVDLMSTDLHMPTDDNDSSTEVDKFDTRGKPDEASRRTPSTQHCPCCLQRTGVNLKMPNTRQKAYAPSSDGGNQTSVIQPTQFPRRFKLYRPTHAPRARSLASDFSSESDERTIVSVEPFERRRGERRNRYQSLPPRRKPPPRLERSAPPKPSHPPPRQLVRSFRPREPLDYRRAWTVDSSTSSGYTSATFQEDDLELTVDPYTSGHYIHNQRIFVTGRRHRETANPKVYYRKPRPRSERDDRFL
ncbi:unnamed protein product [Mesocestoides corti]|uniref:DUF5734 domain-containing protein n=1 Tax=Mesocestoides corti TaxID=53468 RepID=A0A0R3U7N8_MESCO|nr:unnamed protein product [Mesocestoides corti]